MKTVTFEQQLNTQFPGLKADMRRAIRRLAICYPQAWRKVQANSKKPPTKRDYRYSFDLTYIRHFGIPLGSRETVAQMLGTSPKHIQALRLAKEFRSDLFNEMLEGEIGPHQVYRQLIGTVRDRRWNEKVTHRGPP